MIVANLTTHALASATKAALAYMGANTNLITNHVSSLETITWMFGIGADVYALSSTGKILKSTNNGVNWSFVSQVTIAEPKRILYNGSIYVAIGNTGYMATSTDMVNWTYNTNLRSTIWGASRIVEDAIYANGKFIVVGTGARVSVSTDGITWTTTTNLDAAYGGVSAVTIKCVIFTQGKFIVGGTNAAIATSSDGVTWTRQNSLSGTTWGSTDIVYSLASNGSLIMAVGSAGKVATSSDAVTWTYQAGLRSTLWGSAVDVGTVIHNGSLFVVRALTGSSAWYVATSLDGVTWTTYTGSSERPYYGVGLAFHNGVHYAFDRYGFISRSVSLPTWEFPTDILSQGWGGSIPSTFQKLPDGRAIILNTRGSMAVSNGGLSWTYLGNLSNLAGSNFSQMNTRRFAYGANNQLLIFENGNSGGTGAYYLSDPNSLTSFTRYSFTTSQAFCPIWDGSKFIVVGNGGTVRYSTDGINWSTGTDLSLTGWGSTTIAIGVFFTGSFYLAVGSNGRVARSTDGVNWTYIGSIGFNPNDVHWNGTVFMAVGGSGTCVTSPDGITWTSRPLNTVYGTNMANTIAYLDEKHYVFGANGLVAVSEDDGLSWLSSNVLTNSPWGAITVTQCVALDDKIIFGSTSTSALNKLVGAIG